MSPSDSQTQSRSAVSKLMKGISKYLFAKRWLMRFFFLADFNIPISNKNKVVENKKIVSTCKVNNFGRFLT